MFQVTVSCPGKVILHGEHSVVYKKPALAAAIGIRTRSSLKINEIQKITLKYENVDLDFVIDVQVFNNLFNELPNGEITEEETLVKVKKFVDFNTEDKNLDFQKVNAILSTFYLLITMLLDRKLNELKYGFDIILRSDIKIGAGLGSSASFAVSLAGCFLKFINHISETKDYDMNNMKSESSRYAFLSEKVMHGKPSGVDNTVCSFGNIIKFTPDKGIDVISLKEKLPMLLIDTKVSRSTAKLVQHVSELKNDLPYVMDHILNAMGEIVESAVPVYESYTSKDQNIFKNIERFIQINNNLLRACGVSHKSLEEIFNIGLQYDFSCKLTGAGGGGFALIVLPHNYKTEDRFDKLCKTLKEKGFDYIETVMGDDGIKFESISK